MQGIYILAMRTQDLFPSFIRGPARWRPPRKPARNGGFSRVEVSLALGNIAFWFPAILGLLPVGLNSARNAVDMTIGSQIMQRVTTEIRQTDVNSLTATNMLFDDQGNKVTNSSKMLYGVKVTLKAVSLPGGDSANPHLIQATIVIANNPGADPDPFSNPGNANRGNRVCSVLLAGTLP